MDTEEPYGRTRKYKGRPLRIFNNFCHHTFGTFAKPHKPFHNPSFAKEPNFASALNDMTMALTGPKYIERGNIPLALAFKEAPQFYIHKIEEENSNIRLHYIVDGRGMSVHFNDHEKFQQFPNKYEVESGGWYGEKGRWSPIERYIGTIICENYSGLKEISKYGEDFSFKIKKPFLSSSLILTIESEEIGNVQIKCKRKVPQEYTIYLFSKETKQWVLRKNIQF